MTKPLDDLTLPPRMPLTEAATTLDCALNTAWRLGTAGNFPVFRIGRLRFADRAGFARYVASIRAAIA